MEMLNFLLVNIALIASSWLIHSIFRENREEESKANIILSMFVWYCSLVVLIEVGLGIFGWINMMNISLIIYVLFITLLILRKKNLRKKDNNEEKISFQEKGWQMIKRWWLTVIILVPISGVLITKFLTALKSVPLEYDAMVYHLPIIGQWLQTGSLINVYYTAFAGPLGYYPSNFDLFYLWSALPFRNDIFMNFLNIPLFVILGITIYAIAREWKCSRNISICFSTVLLSMPVFLDQAATIFVDVFFTTTFAISLYFLQKIAASNNNQKEYALLFGLSLGLFMGTKYLGIVYAIIPLMIFFIIHIARKQLIKNWRSIAITAIGIFTTGSFFYLRNWLNAGNPLFPVEIKIAGTTIFEGYRGVSEGLYDSSLIAHLPNITTFKQMISGFYTMTNWPGMIACTSFLITVILFIYVVIVKSKRDIITAGTILFSGILMAYFYIRSPYSYRDFMGNIRYAMPFLAIGVINIAYLGNKIKKYQALLLVPIFFVTTWSVIHYMTFQNHPISYPEDNMFSGIIKAGDWFNAHDPDANIAYTGFHFHYPLYGHHFSRKVDYVNINECEQCRYIDYRNSANSIRRDPNYENWTKNLKAQEKQYIVINKTITPQVRSYEFEWIEQHPENFKFIEKFGDTRIYKIIL